MLKLGVLTGVLLGWMVCATLGGKTVAVEIIVGVAIKVEVALLAKIEYELEEYEESKQTLEKLFLLKPKQSKKEQGLYFKVIEKLSDEPTQLCEM